MGVAWNLASSAVYLLRLAHGGPKRFMDQMARGTMRDIDILLFFADAITISVCSRFYTIWTFSRSEMLAIRRLQVDSDGSAMKTSAQLFW